MPDEKYFGVQRDRLRPQALGGDKAQPLTGLFYGDLLAPDSSLQANPREGVAQHPLGGQHQVAAIGPMEGALPDHGEVGEKGAELGLFLYPAKKVAVGGIELHDHRRSSKLGVAHNYIRLILPEGQLRRPRRGQGRNRLGLSLTPELGKALHDVILHLLQVALDLRKTLVFLYQFGNGGGHSIQSYLLVQFL